MSTTASHRPPPKPLDLEITIVSAKHLKNVNWRNGDLNPYAIFWLDPDCRLATKSDDSNSTKPIWNERFLIPVPSSPAAAVLTLEIFHSKPSDTPKPLVGTLKLPIHDLPNPNRNDSTVIGTFVLRRPSGRPHGKIKLKLALRDRPLPEYQILPQPAYNYNTAPPPSYGRYPPSPYTTAPPPPAASPSQPPPPPRPYNYAPYSGCYQGGHYPHPQPSPTPRPYGESSGIGGMGIGGPSAPVDYAQFEQKQKTGKVASELRLGLGVGAVAGVAIDEGLRYQHEKVGERVETDLNARELDDYRGYPRRADY